MEDAGIAVGRDAGQAARAEDLWRAERSVWRRATKPAQIAFGGFVLECALLDASRGGAQVRLLEAAEVPEIATLRLLGGETWTVRRQWQRGVQVGFKVVGTGLCRPSNEPAGGTAPAGCRGGADGAAGGVSPCFGNRRPVERTPGGA